LLKHKNEMTKVCKYVISNVEYNREDSIIYSVITRSSSTGNVKKHAYTVMF